MNNLTINNSAVLDLATSQWIRDAAGGTFSMNNSSKMILSNSFSIPSPSSGLGIVVPEVISRRIYHHEYIFE